MKRLHIFNPAAGKGHSPELLKDSSASDEEQYVTLCVGDAEREAYERCLSEPNTHFIVYGGDGTLNEVVNGIMRAGAGMEALISIVPTGSGNDFIRSLGEAGEIQTVDIMKLNDRYAVNIVNIGFDCYAANRMTEYRRRPMVSGSMAYIFGVTDTLLRPLGEKIKISFTDAEGNVHEEDSELLLTVIANGCYYGGGFMAAPLASIDDGFLDILTVNKVSRRKFLNLVGAYKKGKHLDPDKLEPIEKFKSILRFYRCTSIKVSGFTLYCADGEIYPGNEIEVSVVPQAIRVMK